MDFNRNFFTAVMDEDTDEADTQTNIGKLIPADNSSLTEEYVLKFWDDYIFENVVKTVPCKVAIFDYKTRKKICSSEDFLIQQKEVDEIQEGITFPDLLYRNGVTVGGKNYKVRLADGKTGIFARSAVDGCTVCKTMTLLIIATHTEDAKPALCNEEVMKIGDFLHNLAI